VRNYFKARVGKQTALFFFDDEVPDGMRASLAQARDAAGKHGFVSVWARAETVPSTVLQVGEFPKQEKGEGFDKWRERVGGVAP
jgi:hypothetical protein